MIKDRKLAARFGLGLIVLVAAAIAVLPFGAVGATSERALRICVDKTQTSVDLPAATAKVERIVRSAVAVHPRFTALGYSTALLTVARGCPSAPALLASGSAHPKNGGRMDLLGLTAQPSGFQVFVFVVPSADVSRMFGSLPFRTAGQETVCGRGSCGEVSTALYLDPDSLNGPDNGAGAQTIARGLIQAIGLEAVAPGQPRPSK